jgi:hypothetical protein
MAKTSFDMDDEIDRELENALSYGDTKKEILNDATRLWLEIDPILDELYERHQRDKRRELVVQAVCEKVDEIKNSADKQP